MKDPQGDDIQRGRQKSHDPGEDHAGNHAEADDRAAVPNLMRVAASELKDQTPEGERDRPEESSADQEGPASPLLGLLQDHNKGQGQAPDRKRKDHREAKREKKGLGPGG